MIATGNKIKSAIRDAHELHCFIAKKWKCVRCGASHTFLASSESLTVYYVLSTTAARYYYYYYYGVLLLQQLLLLLVLIVLLKSQTLAL
jgi:hypothetical protein